MSEKTEGGRTTDVVYACGPFAVKAEENMVDELKRLKALVLIWRDFGIQAEEQLFPLKAENSNPKKKHLPKKIRKEMKNCRILGRSARWVFFLAPLKKMISLLAAKEIEIEEMTLSETLTWLAKAEAAAQEKQKSAFR